MKKIISLIMSICMVITGLPMMVYAMDSTPEISLEEFSEQLSEMNEEYAGEPVSNRIIVKSNLNINELDSVDIVEGYDDLHIVQFDNSESARQALEYYNDSNYVEYAEEDMTMSTCDILSDITYDNHLSWGSENIGVDDYIDYLGDVSTLPEVIVGIIDTGIDLDHEFLRDRIIPTGANYSDSGTENSENDDHGHGTHVAGIVVDNTTSNVKIKAFKALNNNGNGDLSSVCLAIEAAIQNKVNVINMSLGVRGKSELLEDTVKKAINNSITVCVSAGNDGENARYYTPANIDECITVGAIDEYDQTPYWSNWGACLDVVAPGVSIYSSYKENSYKNLSGTSMASPFAAAASAMLLSKDIDRKPDDICSALEENGRQWNFNESDTDFYGKLALFIGNIVSINKPRTIMPALNFQSGRYDDCISVEITCEENADIYYTIDGSRASKEYGIKYTEPIIIDKVTSLHAVAYADDKLKSFQTKADYYITYTDDDINFVINNSGIITKYLGSNDYLTIPDKINGITVTGIGNDVFSWSSIVMIKFPDTLISVGDYSFQWCENLYSVSAKELKYIGDNAFENCVSLSKFDFSNLEKIGKYSFSGLRSLIEVDCSKLKIVPDYAFSFCDELLYSRFLSAQSIEECAFQDCVNMKSFIAPEVNALKLGALEYNQSLMELSFPKLTELSDSPFYYCSNLRKVYFPEIKTISGNKVFDKCEKIEVFFAPKLEKINSPINNDCSLYLSDALNEFATVLNKKYKYTIIAPSSSYAEQWANENGHTFIPSDYRDTANDKLDDTDDLNIRAYGRSICCSAAGVRFGFTWDNIDEIENLASDIEYGFIYSQKGAENLSIDTVDNKNIKNVVTNNRVDHGDTTSFNLVISNIPTSYYDREITARAYVCIDGMYFYSNILKGSFSGVANLVLADDEIDQATKDRIQNLLNREV